MIAPIKHPLSTFVRETAGTAPEEGPISQSSNEIASPLGDENWDATLLSSGFGSFFHCAAWARVLRDTYGYSPMYFTSSARGQFTHVLPFMEINSWLTGRRGVSLPFSDECQPLSTDEAGLKILLGKVMEHAKARRWKYMELRGASGLLPRSQGSLSYYGHRLELSTDMDRMRHRCARSVPRAVRKAGRSGLTVEFSREMPALETFQELLCVARKRQGALPQPMEFFRNIQRHVLERNLGWVVLARVHGKAVAGAVFFHFGDTAIFKFGASDPAFLNLRPNNLIMWEAIQWYASHGFKFLDFGRTSLDNNGLRRFKLAWGTQEYPIEYNKISVASGISIPSADASGSWQSRVLKNVPIPVSRLVGGALYRHLA